MLVPNPSYPIHIYGPVIAGRRHPPRADDARTSTSSPSSSRRSSESFPKPKMLIINFPSNPTAQCVELPFFERIVALAREHDIYVVHDLAYADIVFDGWKAPSIMQVPGARDVAVEFFTMSKSYNMAGWRIGFMVGNPRSRQGARAHQGLPRLRHVHADPGGGDRRARRPAGLRRRDRRSSTSKRRDVLVQGAARGRLDGRRAEGVDVRLGARSRRPTARRARSSSRRSCWTRRRSSVSPGIGFGDYGDDARALRADREREPHPAGDPRHQGDVPEGRAPHGDPRSMSPPGRPKGESRARDARRVVQ